LYKKCYSERLGKNKHLIHLWDDVEGYKRINWLNKAYQECLPEDEEYKGLNEESLRKISKWSFSKNPKYSQYNTEGLHFHDMKPYQKFLIEKYGVNDEPSKDHRELYFDIEIEIGGALTEEYIERAPMPVTSIAWYYRQEDIWVIVILDKENQIQYKKSNNQEIIPVENEKDLLKTFLGKFREIDPDILISYNGDFFDIPYLYYRMCKVLGLSWANMLSPIDKVECKRGNDYWFSSDTYVRIAGVESLDYLKLHKKYSWKDEPNYKLGFLGEKHVNLGKIEYTGNLDRLFQEDIDKFIKYNFRDVEILKVMEEKLQYIALTKNISHKGKHNYSEVYYNSTTQDGAISAYLLSQGIIPPPKDPNPIVKKNYAGGYLFCSMAGLLNYMFDEDLTSLYPSILMSLNIGKETLKGRIIDSDDRNKNLGLNDLKQLEPDHVLLIENKSRTKRAEVEAQQLIKLIEKEKWAISANGTFFRTDKKSALSIVLNKWFEERVYYKTKMKEAYKVGDKEKGDHYYLMQFTMKILLNSTYGALSLKGFRYGSIILSEATTLSGQRIICESAAKANRHINKVMNNPKELENFKKELSLD